MPIKTTDQINLEIMRLANRGVGAAAYFFAARLREVLSIPAPRRLVTSARGVRYYVATTPATPGAPPRKLSGTLRRSVAVKLDPSGNSARVGTSPFYGLHLEKNTSHAYLVPTLKKNIDAIAHIIGTTFSTGGNV